MGDFNLLGGWINLADVHFSRHFDDKLNDDGTRIGQP